MRATADITHEGFLTPDQAHSYVHLPLPIPQGVQRIDVWYSYTSPVGAEPGASSGNTLDIGIFDARGIGFLDAGFRGWSGSARRSFFIATHDATPGYMAGPIEPGTWNICLGPYKVAQEGCRYRVNVKLTFGSEDAPVEFPARLTTSGEKTPPPRPDGWYRGELHCHTVNSDGDSTVEEIIRRAQELNLDFLAITDHNTLAHQAEMAHSDTPIVLIPGMEVTTNHGHWNVWGDGGWVDFRIESAEQMARAIAEANRMGYLVSCNHPRPFGPEWTYSAVTGYACVEVWNGPWPLLNSVSLAFWEARLAKGERLTAVGGSDHHYSHQPHIAQLGHPTVYIQSQTPPTAAQILAALRAGRAFISERPDGARLWFEADGKAMGEVVQRPPDGELRLEVHARAALDTILIFFTTDGPQYNLQIDSNPWDRTVSIQVGDSPYVRAALLNPESGDVCALTNPIYIA